MGVPPPQWNWIYRALARNHSRDVVDFLLERGEIGNRHALIFLDRDVARAKKAKAFAERKMHVQRERRAAQIGGGVAPFEIVGAEIVLPNRSGGIAGVARAGAIVFGEKFFGDLADVEAAIAARARGFCRGGRRNRRANRRGLSCVHKCFGVCYRRRRQDSVARFKMWPRPPVFAMASRAARRIEASSPSRTSGSTFPCSAI